jgi:hypothetical protein
VLSRFGFPAPDGRRAHLLMKRPDALADDDWKALAREQVNRLGPVVLAFDNEPAHVNAYARAWPGAMVVHVDTNDSGRPVEVLAGVPSVEDFDAPAALSAAAEGATARGP